MKRNLTNEVNELVTSNLSSGGNQMVGSIPSSFGQLRNLKLLWLGKLHCQNQMDCFNIKTFTSEILFCVQLYCINDIDDNNLTGPLPTQLGNLRGLLEFNISKCI